MQNSFGSRARASYLLAAKGAQQPRSLVQAFPKPVKPYGAQDLLTLAVAARPERCDNCPTVAGAVTHRRATSRAAEGGGVLEECFALGGGDFGEVGLDLGGGDFLVACAGDDGVGGEGSRGGGEGWSGGGGVAGGVGGLGVCGWCGAGGFGG